MVEGANHTTVLHRTIYKDNANKWLAGCEDKKKQFMTDDEIVDVMTREEKRKRRKTEKQRQLFT